MKTFRFLLGAAALFLAAGLTFAGQANSDDAITAYEYINTGGTIQCKVLQTDCSVFGETVCLTAAGNEIRENSMSSSQCGVQLKRDH